MIDKKEESTPHKWEDSDLQINTEHTLAIATERGHLLVATQHEILMSSHDTSPRAVADCWWEMTKPPRKKVNWNNVGLLWVKGII